MDTPVFSLYNCLKNQPIEGLPDANHELLMGMDEGRCLSRSGGRCQIKQARSVLLIWTTMIVMIGILPLDNFVGHSHWEYIKWTPNAEDLKSPKYLLDIFTDIIGNTALFFPFGYLLGHLQHNRTPSVQLIFAATLAGALSVSIEYYQIYCHNRFPSIIDVICNVFGSLIGARYARFGLR